MKIMYDDLCYDESEYQDFVDRLSKYIQLMDSKDEFFVTMLSSYTHELIQYKHLTYHADVIAKGFLEANKSLTTLRHIPEDEKLEAFRGYHAFVYAFYRDKSDYPASTCNTCFSEEVSDLVKNLYKSKIYSNSKFLHDIAIHFLKSKKVIKEVRGPAIYNREDYLDKVRNSLIGIQESLVDNEIELQINVKTVTYRILYRQLMELVKHYIDEYAIRDIELSIKQKNYITKTDDAMINLLNVLHEFKLVLQDERDSTKEDTINLIYSVANQILATYHTLTYNRRII